MTFIRSRVAAAGAVVALSVVALSAGAASAAPQDFGNIDAGRTGSLTVHKFLHQQGTVEGDISQAPAATDFTDPVAGVVFTAYPLIPTGQTTPIDLNVAANWNLISAATPGLNCVAPAGFTLGTGLPLPSTDDKGFATRALPVTAYQVCETSAPVNIVDTAAPFIVTVPMPHENGWVYDVHAYPKNGAAKMEKTIVTQAGLGLGAPVQFTVTTAIPTMEGQAWTAYAISDTFDNNLNVNTATQGVASVTIDGTPLATNLYRKVVSGKTVVVEFTADGVAWLNSNPGHAGEELVIVFDATVATVGDGSIENTAQLWTNNPNRDSSSVPVPSNEVRTNWGSLEIQKIGGGVAAPEGALAGATFEVYAAADPYAADCTTATATGPALSVSGQTTFTSNADGIVRIAGLYVSDSESDVVNATERCYVLKETAAPAGYVLPTGGAEFTGVTVEIGETEATVNAAINNTQQDVPNLPLTGGSGTAVLISAGFGAVAVAVGLALMKRRRQAADAS